jgi:hypothetical protein
MFFLKAAVHCCFHAPCLNSCCSFSELKLARALSYSTLHKLSIIASGLVTAAMSGDLRQPGSATIPPHRLGTTVQLASFSFG